MRHAWLIFKIVAIPLLAILAAGCTAERRLIATNDLVTAAYNEIGGARDAGIITQADINPYLPIRDRIDKALDAAGRLHRSGDIPGMDASLAFVKQTLLDLRPLLNEIATRRQKATQ